MGVGRWIEECLCCISCKQDRPPSPPPYKGPSKKPPQQHHQQPTPQQHPSDPWEHHEPARQPSQGPPPPRPYPEARPSPDPPLETRYSTASQGSVPRPPGGENDRRPMPVQPQPAPPNGAPARTRSRPVPNLEDTYVAASMAPVRKDELEAVSQMLVGLGTDIVEKADQDGVRDSGLIKIKELGKGGFGTVWLCEREGADATSDGQVRKRFALKELMVSQVFRPGVDNLHDHIKNHIPVNEAAIQQFMQHENVVKTYWSDVRVVDPRTKEPLNLNIKDLGDGALLTKNKVDDLDKTFVEAARKPRGGKNRLPPEVHLQLRIAMEYCKLGCLKDYLRDPMRGQHPESLSVLVSARLRKLVPHDYCALMTALDIANALKLMHKNRILHGDLKPHNVLLAASKDPKDPNDKRGFVAKLADFGLAAIMQRGHEKVPIKNGTIAYLPRDAFQHMAATTKTDVYALGLILWELWHGIFWFSIYDAEKRRRRATTDGMHGYVPRCATDCPAPFAEVVHACLSDDPKKRPEVKEICRKLTALIPTVSPDFV